MIGRDLPAMPVMLVMLVMHMTASFSLLGAASDPQALTVGAVTAEPGQMVSGWLEVPEGPSPPGTPGSSGRGTRIPVTVVNGAKPGAVLALVAGTHGYEYTSIIALQRLRARLDPARMSGAVILVHLANPPTFYGRRIYYGPDGKNLNRMYPGRQDGTISERIAHAITEEVIAKSTHLADMHCGDGNESLRPYTYWMISGNAEVDEASKQMALAYGLDHIVIDRDRPADPARSVYTANTAILRGKPAITTESGGMGLTDDASVAAHEAGALSLIAHLKIMDAPQIRVEKPLWIVRGEVLRAPQDGVWRPVVEKMQMVAAGTLIGRIVDPFGAVLHEIRAPFGGEVLYVVATPPVAKDEPLAYIGEISLQEPQPVERQPSSEADRASGQGEAQAGETETAQGPGSAGRTMRATRATSPIILDGRLDEETWALAEKLTSFTQRYPAEGEPASQPSEVRILYDDERLLIGAKLFDSEPARLVAREMKEDSDLDDDDVFGILLDTYHDRRNGFYFETNPNGARSDALIYDEGRTESFDWDGVWDVSCRVTDAGWVVEMEIPFRTLYFDPAKTNPWGLQIWRGIRRNTEDVYWAPVPRNEDLFRVSRAGELHGLEGIRQGSRLSVKPYALGEASATAGAGDEPRDGRGDIGLDARYHLTPNLAGVLTINTDFAETEVDEQQVNTTRFPLFFPEKREFFLESTGYFEFGFNRSGPGAPPGVIPFFSRRIGLHPEDGVPIPIQAGVKLSGRMGRYNLGFVSINEDDDLGLPQTNYSVLRMSRDFLTRSNWGIIGASKEPVGPDDPFDPNAPLAGTHSNRTYGADLNFSVLDNLKFGGSLLQTRTPSVTGGEGAGHAYAYWSDDAWSVEFSYRDIAEFFNPEVGFVERTGIEEAEGFLGWSWRSDTALVRQIEPHSRVIYTMDQSHALATRYQHWATTVVLRDGSEMEVGWNPGFDKLTETFVLSEEDGALVPAGSYSLDEWIARYSSDESDPVSFSVFSEFGDFFDGDYWSVEGDVVARITRHVRGELGMSRTEIDLPARDDDPLTPVLDPLPSSSFDFTLGTARVGLAFTTRLTLDTLLQYNTELEDFSTNLRLNYKYRPGSDIYVVYNERNDTEGMPADTTDRTLTVKWTYLMAF